MFKNEIVTTKQNTIDVRVYKPDHPKASMLILHGISEHKGRYDYLMNFFKEHDIYGVIYDHVGHGNRDYGNRGHIEDIRTLVSDAYAVYNHLPKDLPKFVMGHSMGSIVLRLLLTQISPAGAMIIGTGERNTTLDHIETAFINLFAKVKPNSKSVLLNRLAFIGFDSHIAGNTRNRWLSENYENVLDYNQDPFSGHPMTMKSYKDVNNAIYAVSKYNIIRKYSRDTSYLLLSGANDGFSHYGKDINTLDARLKACGLNTTSVLIKNYRHEVLNEKQKNNIYRMIIDWMTEVVRQTKQQ